MITNTMSHNIFHSVVYLIFKSLKKNSLVWKWCRRKMTLIYRILKQIYLTRRIRKIFIIFIGIIGICIAGYFLLDEEDIIRDEEPWPGHIYRSNGLIYRNLSKENNNLFEYSNNLKLQKRSTHGGHDYKPIVTLAVVSCKRRMEEAMTMLKSAVLFSKNIRLDILAISDKKSLPIFAKKIEELRNIAKGIGIEVEYEVYKNWFPSRVWRRMFLPCSSQRLFFPSLFQHVDSVMYIDTDVYFVSDLGHLWKYFKNMNTKHIAAMANEHELPGDGWYNLYSKCPYYGERGLNAGIMLMNLTKMRKIKLEEKSIEILNTYGWDLTWADQDILNVLFYFNPEYLYKLKCEYNFRAQHCKCDYPGGDGKECSCNSAIQNGVAVIHGNRRRFHYYEDYSLEFFRDFYNDFDEYDLRRNEPEKLLDKLAISYNRIQYQPCKMSSDTLLTQFSTYLKT